MCYIIKFCLGNTNDKLWLLANCIQQYQWLWEKTGTADPLLSEGGILNLTIHLENPGTDGEGRQTSQRIEYIKIWKF